MGEAVHMWEQTIYGESVYGIPSTKLCPESKTILKKKINFKKEILFYIIFIKDEHIITTQSP